MQDRVDLDELEESDAKRTPGMWYPEDVSERDMRRTGWGINIDGSWDMVLETPSTHNEHDAHHIAKAVNALPSMIAELRGLRKLYEAMSDYYGVFDKGTVPTTRLDELADAMNAALVAAKKPGA